MSLRPYQVKNQKYCGGCEKNVPIREWRQSSPYCNNCLENESRSYLYYTEDNKPLCRCGKGKVMISPGMNKEFREFRGQ